MKNGSTKTTSNMTSTEKPKRRRKAPIKIVLRRLPSAMTWEQLETQLNPIPEYEFAEFIAADSSGGVKFSRVYFAFKNEEDVVAFKERFHGYVFVDNKGGESVGIVELAPNPKVPKDKMEACKERDFKCDSIETDHEFKKFISEKENPPKPDQIPMEQLIKEIDEKEKMAGKNAVQETPLTQYMIKKAEGRFKRIEGKRRVREDERRARMERRYENELKDKHERKDAKKVMEFRNSKLERNSEEVEKEKERTKNRIHRSGDYKMEKENKRRQCDRDKRRESPKKGRDTSANKDCSPKKTKQNDENETLKDEKIKESRKEKRIDKDNETTKTDKDNETTKNDVTSKDDIESISADKSGAKVSKVIMNRALTIKSSSSSSPATETTDKGTDKEVEKGGKSGNDVARPRRNKDRPERAIYQPGAARRRAAALAASNLAATENASATTKGKP